MKTEIIEKDVDKLVNKANTLITNTVKKINYELVNMYWNIGKMIVEYKRKNNSKYGDTVITRFSKELGLRYGKGFSSRNIKCSINLYNYFENGYPGNRFKNVSWSHYREIINFKNRKHIEYYLNEVELKNLTKNELIYTVRSKSYERTISNQRKGLIKNELESSLRDPIILNIQSKKRTEKELEDEIIKNVFGFMDEIGNNMSLVKRQYKININGLIHKVDLVFLDYETNTFILVDLKINKVTNHDIMQMKLYIEYFSKDKKIKNASVIGLILCETKDSRLIENDNIYQIKYLNEMPKDKELLRIINENKVILLKTEKLELEKLITNCLNSIGL